jgi:hypothetical protein
MSAFVGTCTVDSAEELRSLIEQIQGENSCFFLRWPYKVSGFCKALPDDFPSPEGQVFDSQKELRWKVQGTGYSVLLLSNQSDPVSRFTALDGNWEACDRPAHCHESKKTRYPKGFYFDTGIEREAIQQRYFRDRQTATIHFVALTLANQP